MAKSIGRVIAELRRDAGLTKAQLARAAGISPGELTRIENRGRPNIRLVTATQLARALGISLDQLASLAGLAKGKAIGGPRPSGEGAIVLAELDKVESALQGSAARVNRLKKRLRSE